MPPNHSATCLRHIKLLLLVLAVLVVLVQTSSDGWLRTCGYGLGKCRKVCLRNERRKESCRAKYQCCIKRKKKLPRRSSHSTN